MRQILSTLAILLFVSACGGPQLSPAQQTQRETNIAQTDAAVERAKTVQINGKSFRVAHVVERNQALVELTGSPVPYFVAEVEAASRAATGCNGAFNPGVLAFLGGDIASADLAELRTKVSGRFSGWSVKLSC
ncbi:MAG: hypothetical protein ABJ370_22615 [Paracoccaceae bacterium]